MITDAKRLEWIVRTANLLRDEIERNGNVYHGGMVPNLTSITDLATVDAAHLESVEASLLTLESKRGARS